MKYFWLFLVALALTGCGGMRPISYVIDNGCALEGDKAVLAKKGVDKIAHPHRVTIECDYYLENPEE